jgi:hypothetical protein
VVSWNKFTCDTKSSQGTGGAASGLPGLGGTNGTTVTVQNCCVVGPGMCGQVKDASQCTNGTYQAKACSEITECSSSGQKCGLSSDGACQQGLTCPSGWWAVTGSPTNSCPSGQTCCSKGYWPNPAESCSVGDGSCYYASNFCPSGYHSIIGVCSKSNSVCCIKDPYWPSPAESCALGAGKCYFNSNTCPSGFRSIIGACSIPMSVCCQGS